MSLGINLKITLSSYSHYTLQTGFPIYAIDESFLKFIVTPWGHSIHHVSTSMPDTCPIKCLKAITKGSTLVALQQLTCQRLTNTHTLVCLKRRPAGVNQYASQCIIICIHNHIVLSYSYLVLFWKKRWLPKGQGQICNLKIKTKWATHVEILQINIRYYFVDLGVWLGGTQKGFYSKTNF